MTSTFAKRALERELKRFDSATHFSTHRPPSCGGEKSGNLQILHPQKLGEEQRDFSKELQAETTACKGIKTFTSLHAGKWAEERSENKDFAEHLASGLSTMATLCGTSVRSQNTKSDPWAITACLTDDENRALAAIIAEVLLREMKTQNANPTERQSLFNIKDSQEEEKHEPSSPGVSRSAIRFPSLARHLAPRPPTSKRPSSRNIRARSLRKSLPHSISPTLIFEAQQESSEIAIPPSKEFWSALARAGVRPAGYDPGAPIRQFLKESPPRRSCSNSITTA